ncbi:ATP-dependent helicase [Sinanaerobacter sp. ZZT-01]|uniref:ATP-dependent helicase n=1 Tax=Sinanaerobacter sp. ZZT-01 TaxID=3111540 RepID=UPI002D77413F|nr:UvrD-helicase domain-containing protein [Sinanaerobacter sp. ZZT-01]WRR94111.1 UvrD-helicase domain-containing protein [Sinanaerobacter sp. ZZT-01]
MDYLNKLNVQQREAAMHTEGPLLILAGAGSGKTSTMTHRIAYLIREKGVSPYEILAVTFTNKAAKEMRDRIENLVGNGINMWILTFHSACLRILRSHADKLGYDKDFVVYDPTDQKVVIKNSLKQQKVDDKKYTPAYVLSVISDCKEKNISAAQYMQKYGNDYKGKVIAPLYQAYETALKKNNAMDFDDLILRTVQLFEKDEETLRVYQNRFQYIMVDEYQDTNFMQYRFIKLLAEANKNICVVGDDDQCIYQWRGADIKNILEFEKDFSGAKVIKLEQNYRSHENILNAAHSVIEHNHGRKHKKLWTDKEKGEKIHYYRADDDREEARYIAQAIDRLKTNDRRYSDFAVLYRTNTQSRRFEDAFSAKDIPYRVLGGFRYYDRKEIKDMMCYMRLVLNQSDDLSFERIINEPKRGIGDKTVEKLKAFASVRNESLFTLLCDAQVREGLPSKSIESVKELVEAICQLGEEKDNLKVSDIYDGLLVRSGYLKNLEMQSTVEAESRIENLLEFKSVIYDAEKENPNITLSEFMEKIALVAEVDNHDADENAVVLMTMHSAKGLEFPVVFMPGMEDGLFPSWRAFEKPDGVEEERRLCYVGMTRAMEQLYLTSAETRTLYGKTDYTKESTFLRELDRAYMEGDAVYKKKPQATGYNAVDTYSSGEIFRPFAQLNTIKQNKTARPSVAGVNLVSGDRVSHNKFGEGLVIEVLEKTVTVIFDTAGTKKLAKDIAPLKKI